MSQSLYSAVNGLKTQQSNIDTIANNIANINTSAYKKSRINLKDAVYSELIDPSAAGSSANLQLGYGVLVAGQSKYFEQGFLDQTNRNLDIAIQGDGFFAVEGADKQVAYTRNGSFSTKTVDGSNYLATMSGDFVLDKNGNRIKCNFPIEQISVNSKGELANNKTPNELIATLGIYNFTNPLGLESLGATSYLATDSSGAPITGLNNSSKILQGYIENSNVDLSEEMTQLMEAQKAYTFLSRAISTADQMKSIENDIRK